MDLKNNINQEIQEIENGFLFEKNISKNSFILIADINENELIDNLIMEGREKLKTNKSVTTNVVASHTGFHSMRESPNFHLFLKKIHKYIKKIYFRNFEIREVWANFYSKPNSDYAKMHAHDANAFSGILYCTDGPGPGTYFPQYDLNIKEKKGRFVLFSEDLLHEVKPYNYEKERITIAFNFFELKPWGNNKNSYLIKEDNKEIIL
jgi:hypothetical protein